MSSPMRTTPAPSFRFRAGLACDRLAHKPVLWLSASVGAFCCAAPTAATFAPLHFAALRSAPAICGQLSPLCVADDRHTAALSASGQFRPYRQNFIDSVPEILCVYLCVIRRKCLMFMRGLTGSNPVSRTIFAGKKSICNETDENFKYASRAYAHYFPGKIGKKGAPAVAPSHLKPLGRRFCAGKPAIPRRIGFCANSITGNAACRL